MSQNSPTNSSSSTRSPHINPVLRAAIASLNVQLEDELARYWHQKARTTATSRQPGKQKSGRRSQSASATAQAATRRATDMAPSPNPDPLPAPSNSAPELSWLDNLPVTADLESDLGAHFTHQSLPHDSPPTQAEYNVQSSPEDYLASSEQLLRNVAQAEREAKPGATRPNQHQQKRRKSWFTSRTFGVIVFTSLVATAAGAAFASNFERLRWLSSLFEQSSPNPPLTQDSTSTPSESSIANHPDLASKEFIDLELETLAQVSPERGTNSSVPVPKATATQEERLPSQGEPSTAEAVPASLGGSYYYVVVADTSDLALQKIRSLEPAAYLVNFPIGVRVQVGAFNRKSDANKLVERLKQLGISATVYRP